MHTKQLGALGEAKITSYLISKGYFVFKELSDLCKTDLIIIGDAYDPIKIQVKCLGTKNGAIQLGRRKSGPGYTFSYQREHADVYAIYAYDEDKIYFVPAEELLLVRSSFTLRVRPCKGKTKNLHLAENYLEFERALRDYTRSTPPVQAEGEDIVQTTTSEDGS